MKKHLLSIVIGLCLFSSVKGQTPTEQAIYNITLDSLYKRTSLSGTIDKDVSLGHFVFVDKEISDGPSDWVKNRTYTDYGPLLKGVTNSSAKTFAQNTFEGAAFCYSFIDKHAKLNFKKNKKCAQLSKKKKLNAIRYSFSSITYAADKQSAVVFLRQKWSDDASNETIWLISLQKNGNGWQIKDMDNNAFK